MLGNCPVVLFQGDETVGHLLVGDLAELLVVEHAGLGINFALSESSFGLVFGLLEQEGNGWLDSQSLEKVDLSLVLGEALHYPSVELAFA